MVMLGSVSFDGLSGGETYQSIVPDLRDLWMDAGLNLKHALSFTFATGYVVAIVLVMVLYRAGVFGAARMTGRRNPGELGHLFVHSLVPIAFAYVGAHYISLLVAALCAAHDRALVVYHRARDAVRSQYWMIAVMIVFTTLALWLLSQQNDG